MLTRDIPFTMNALEEVVLVTCSAITTTAGSTSPVGLLSSKTTASAVVANPESTVFGRVIDRLRFPIGTKYDQAAVGAWVHSTRGSTEPDRKLTVGVKLQHGDSSAGGDMADYSTAQQPATRTWFSTGRTSDMKSWDASESTGEVYAQSNPGIYDLRGAKRYLRVGAVVFKDRVTTESSGDEQARVGGAISFLCGIVVPQNLDTTGPYSSSTST